MAQPPVTARELMTQHIYTLHVERPVFEAAGLLLREGFSGAPVIDADGALVGVLSEKDLLRALLCVEGGKTPEGVVGDWMSAAPVTASPEATVYELARFFRDHPIRRVPVVEQGRLIGLVARMDVLRALHRLALEVRRQQADAISPPPRH